MSLEDNVRALERTPLLGEAGSDALRLLAFSADSVKLNAGDVLFARGDAAGGGFTVVRGKIKLDAGGGDVVVAGPGALIGEMALLVDTERPCDAYALEQTHLLAIPRPLFLRMLEEFPAIAAGLRGKLLARLRAEFAALERVKARLDKLPSRDE